MERTGGVLRTDSLHERNFATDYFFQVSMKRSGGERHHTVRDQSGSAAPPDDSHLGALLVRARALDEEWARVRTPMGVSRSWLQSGAVRLGVAGGVEASIDRVSAPRATKITGRGSEWLQRPPNTLRSNSVDLAAGLVRISFSCCPSM